MSRHQINSITVLPTRSDWMDEMDVTDTNWHLIQNNKKLLPTTQFFSGGRGLIYNAALIVNNCTQAWFYL